MLQPFRVCCGCVRKCACRQGPGGPAPAARQSSTLEALFEGEPSRSLLTCCVRLSPEKEPQRFVELVEAMASSGLLQQLQVGPEATRMRPDQALRGAGLQLAVVWFRAVRKCVPGAWLAAADAACLRVQLSRH